MENQATESNSDLKIELNGLRNSKGHVLISLFSSSKGWPDDPDASFKKLRLPAQKNTMSFAFKNIPAGKYAIAIIHDENDNLRLDTGLFGIPKEGFCFSNNAMGTFGPPSFESAAFTFGPNTYLKLNISYW
jgi:uncharacterized protein (DUF2141 family)